MLGVCDSEFFLRVEMEIHDSANIGLLQLPRAGVAARYDGGAHVLLAILFMNQAPKLNQALAPDSQSESSAKTVIQRLDSTQA